MSKPIPLLVIDVQNGFVNEKSKGAVGPVCQLIEEWHRLRFPVYATRFWNVPGSQWENLLGWSRLQTSPEIDLHPDVLKALASEDRIVNKGSYTSLTGEFLADLQDSVWDTVVICGIATDGCVLKTAVDIFEFRERPVRPVVLSDACGSHAGLEVHNAGLLLLKRFIGTRQVTTRAEFSADVANS